ncbi:anti-sigma factor antagonist [Streptomyces canus]|uniref:anti-sigma factor antagonist n=2 Tax=Streptomyces canus TaxID=58343 RepID=UPI00386C9275|nr:anti-sigma factor antagonist [Streptomyces canus]
MQQGNSTWPMGRIHSQQVSGFTVVEFHGEIDIAAAQQILPDLDAERRIEERGGRLPLVCPHPMILRILHAGNLTGRFTPLAAQEEALALADPDTSPSWKRADRP